MSEESEDFQVKKQRRKIKMADENCRYTKISVDLLSDFLEPHAEKLP
jgi:hypothetical protein